MAVRPRGLSDPARTAGAVLAVAIALAGIAGGVAAARTVDDARVGVARRQAVSEARLLDVTLDEAALAVRALADGAARDGVGAFRAAARPVTSGTAIRAVSLATLEPDGVARVVTTAPSSRPPLARGEPVAAPELVAAAVSSSLPTIGVAPDGTILAVAPVVGTVADAPLSTRRAATTGVVAAVLDIHPLLDGLFGSAPVLLDADGTTVYERGEAGGDLLTTTVEVTDATWRLTVDRPARSTGWVPWTIAAAGLLLGAAAGLAMHRAVRARLAADQAAADRNRQLTRIADTGGRVQQTLDLGELLPAFALGLVDEYDLRHVSITLVDDEGREVEAFATGERSAGEPPFELTLRRGWRYVGRLAVRARSPLDASERTSLQALGDLLAVALSNAQLLQREQEATARLRELDALKNAFLGTVSHELRTSMTAIMGFGELLVEAWDDMSEERRRELAERVRRSAGSLRHLVDDLLDFARLEQQQVRLSPRPLDLAETVSHTVEALRSLLGEHHVDLRARQPVPAFADPVAVERIVANLVSNAGKYAPAGTTVSVHVEPAGDRARLVVADQGPGIPEPDRKRIFVRFYRLESDATTRTRGAGIGLSILREFADRSGAVVRVDDAPGGGARFTVDFPTEPPTPVADEPAASGGRMP